MTGTDLIISHYSLRLHAEATYLPVEGFSNKKDILSTL